MELSEQQKSVVQYLLVKPPRFGLSIVAQYTRLRQGMTTAIFHAALQSNWKRIYFVGMGRLLKSFTCQEMYESLKSRMTHVSATSIRKKYENDSVVIIDMGHQTIKEFFEFLVQQPYYNSDLHIIATLSLSSMPCPRYFKDIQGGQEVIINLLISTKHEKEKNVLDAVNGSDGKIRAHFIDQRPKNWNDDWATVEW